MNETMNVLHTREQLFEAMQVARLTNITLDIEGPPGIGKTDMIKDLAEWGSQPENLPEGLDPDTLPDDWRPRVCVFYASQWTGEDIVGYPTNDAERGLIFTPPERLRMLQPGDILVFDEKTTPASPSTIKAMLQLTQDDRPACGDWVGPKHVTRITLGNRAQDGNVDYEANPVQGNRTLRREYLGPTVDEWLNWAVPRGVHPVIATSLRMEGRDLLIDFNPERDRNPTPRSWWNGSKALMAMERIAGGRRALNVHQRMSTLASAVGDAAALKLEAIFQLADSMVPYSEIVLNPTSAHVPDPAREPNELFLAVTHIGNRCEPDHWSRVAQYIKRLPIEMQGTCVAPIIKRHPALMTTPEFMEYETRTVGLVI